MAGARAFFQTKTKFPRILLSGVNNKKMLARFNFLHSITTFGFELDQKSRFREYT